MKRALHAPAAAAALALSATGPAWGQATSPGPTISGYLQIRETYEADAGLSASVHRARVLLDGSFRGAVSYRISVDFSSESDSATTTGFELKDAYVRWTRGGATLTVGQFKAPFAREFLVPANQLDLPDRAIVVDSLAPERDIGVMGGYAFALGPNGGGAAAVTLGVFNGEGENTFVNADSTVLVVGRFTARPGRALTLGADVAAYGSDSTRYGADASLESGRVALRAEYLGQHRRAGGSARDDRGWYVLVAYRLRPNLQLVARQEDLQQYALSPGQRSTAVTGGANLDFADGRARLQLAYVSRAEGAPSTRTGTALAQLQVRF